MRPTLRLAPLAALAAVLLTGGLSASHAANCELPLKAHYSCSATFSDGGSSEYCIHTNAVIPGDGQFVLDEDQSRRFFCTCEAKGKAPGVRFGASTQRFFCRGDSVALAGKVTGSKLAGQGYDTSLGSGLRSMFTCRAVAACP